VIPALIGAGALLAALALAGFAALLSFWAGWRQEAVLARAGRRAVYAAAACLLVAAAALEWALLSHDFQVAFVAEHTDLVTPVPLVVAAFYSGQQGSLLYWALILSLLGSASLAAAAALGVRLAAYAAGVLAGVLAFFLVVLVFLASPFDLLAFPPADRLGLNPVLRDRGMLIHPPFVLAGFAAFAIPFSFAVAALLAGRSDSAWMAHTRQLALTAWALQSTGLVLGMWWAYHVLGWGGYWGWDPVENVALLPWLATTAYLHSSQVQERRGRAGTLRAWNFGLVILAFLLVVFGTFIVRSGVVQSVHTFAVSPIGPWFFGLLAFLVVLSGGLLAFRARMLAAQRPLELAANREGAFLLQNLLLVGVAAAVFWGTVLPLVSGLVSGESRVVGAGFYERAAGPLLVVLLALLATGPLLPWRRTHPSWRALAWPAGAGLLALATLVGFGVRDPVPLLVMPLLAAGLATVLFEFGRLLRRPRRLRVLGYRRRHYGAYLAHLGLLLLAAGIAGSHFWQQQRDVVLRPGETANVAGYQLTYQGTLQRDLGDRSELVAVLRLGGETLEPARVQYPSLGGQGLTRVAIRSTPLEDLYVILAGGEGDSASFRILVNPLVTWVWAGGALLVLGVAFGNLGAGRRPSPVAAPVPALVRG